MRIIYLVTLFIVIILSSGGCISEEKTVNTETGDKVDTTITLNEKTLTVGETLTVGDGIEISVLSIDSGIVPRGTDVIPKQAFLSLAKDGNILDKMILENGENYNYGNILELKVEDMYSTDTSDGATLKNIIYRKNGDAPLKTSKLLTTGETLELGKGFTMSIDQIYRESPRKASITLSESGVKKDEKIVTPGEIYSYDNRITVNIDKIFSGPTIDIITMDVIK